MEEMINSIITLGFPTTACIVVAGYLVKVYNNMRDDMRNTNERLHEIIEKSTECITNNTNALYELKEVVKNGKE